MDMHKDNWYNILTNKNIARIFIPTGIYLYIIVIFYKKYVIQIYKWI